VQLLSLHRRRQQAEAAGRGAGGAQRLPRQRQQLLVSPKVTAALRSVDHVSQGIPAAGRWGGRAAKQARKRGGLEWQMCAYVGVCNASQQQQRFAGWQVGRLTHALSGPSFY
jgi:hypothetical protein